MNEVQRFAPTVKMPDGETVTPAGWMWVVGFALGGCEWAIKEADTPEFKERIRAYYREQRKENIEREIEKLETQLGLLKAELLMTKH